MSKRSIYTLLLATWLLAAPTASIAGAGATTAAAATARPLEETDDQRSLRQAIATLEAEHGAYGSALPEQLLSLGLTLQRAGRHRDAVTVFKRGTHLARVTSGLYSPDQLPLLQAEIESLQVLQDYPLADARQRYLHRVQMRSLPQGRQRVAALVAHANWQRQAYLLALDEEPGYRLLEMWELNRQALNSVLEEQGDQSRDLLPPLYGMLHAQYLISDYQWRDASDFQGTQSFAERGYSSRRSGYRKDSYDKGHAVIRAIYDLERLTNPEDPGAATRAQTMLGDWMLWHGEREQAMAVYRQAIGELAATDSAQVLMEDLFAEPVALPALEALRSFPQVASMEEGDILLEFAVTADGKVADLSRLDDNSEVDGVANRLMRKLRRTPFRPRFDLNTGEPVATEKLTRAYESTD